MKTAVEWLEENIERDMDFLEILFLIKHAKEMEKNDIDNKVIHFAEWLTKKHTSTLITLYEHFKKEYYKETFKSE
jgi:hypothetical protein